MVIVCSWNKKFWKNNPVVLCSGSLKFSPSRGPSAVFQDELPPVELRRGQFFARSVLRIILLTSAINSQTVNRGVCASIKNLTMPLWLWLYSPRAPVSTAQLCNFLFTVHAHRRPFISSTINKDLTVLLGKRSPGTPGEFFLASPEQRIAQLHPQTGEISFFRSNPFFSPS